jgi:hypothetical protein
MKFMLLCYDDEAAWEKAGHDAPSSVLTFNH